MPRIARGLADGFVYHVTNRGNGKQRVFHKDKDYDAFIDLMRETKNRYSVKILAYCLMPNHFHMLLLPKKGEELSKYMQWLMTSHVRRYHKHYGSSGHVWQGRFKSFIVQEDRHLLIVARYIEANSVRAGLVTSVDNWKWSSYLERVDRKSNDLIEDLQIDLPKDWKAYVNTPLTDEELKRVSESVNRQSPYGEFSWLTKICTELGLESTIKPRGRPSKSSLSPFL